MQVNSISYNHYNKTQLSPTFKAGNYDKEMKRISEQLRREMGQMLDIHKYQINRDKLIASRQFIPNTDGCETLKEALYKHGFTPDKIKQLGSYNAIMDEFNQICVIDPNIERLSKKIHPDFRHEHYPFNMIRTYDEYAFEIPEWARTDRLLDDSSKNNYKRISGRTQTTEQKESSPTKTIQLGNLKSKFANLISKFKTNKNNQATDLINRSIY